MKKLGSFIIFFNFLILGSTSAASSIKVESTISDKNLEVGDQVTYKIIVTSKERLTRPGANFKPPLIKGLDYMGVSESSSTGIRIVNSKRSATYKVTMSISYACLKAGMYTVPSLDLDLKGVRTRALKFRVYKSLPKKLKIKRSPVAGKRRSQMNSLLDQFMGRGSSQANKGVFAPEFFTKVELDKTEVFKGEQIIATWYVYLSPNTALTTFDTLEFPTLRGFWKEDVHFSSRFHWKPVTMNGKTYIRSVLSSYALTPYNAGTLVVDSFNLRVVVARQSFFNRSRKILNSTSEKVEVRVKPLPKPIPSSYFGGVGRFKVDGGQRGRVVQALYGDPIIYKVRIIGDRANTKFIKPPKLDLGSDFSLYDTEEEFIFVPQKISSYKDFKYTIVPKKEGVLRMPEVKVSFLDPSTEEYYHAYVKPPTFRVLPNKNVKKIKDMDYGESGEGEAAVKKGLIFKPKKGRSILDYLYKHTPYSVQGVLLLLVLLLCFGIYKTKSKVVEETQETLIKQLEERTHKAAATLRQGKKKEALDELINVYSLLIGGVSGKRYGVEEEFAKAAENLPPSLKSGAEELKKLNATLQELRFGATLESKENQVKLQECLKQFNNLFLEVREYLR